MGLKKYQAKRKFHQTPEPRGQVAKKNQYRFVVQEHHARQLHYDFRLEMDGVLKSWAVPKGVPEKPGIKHLAVMTEDHPLEYGKFEGFIPAGNYGAGKVTLWDSGKYAMIEKKEKSLKFVLRGKRLLGEYVLFNFKDKNWFIFKVKE